MSLGNTLFRQVEPSISRAWRKAAEARGRDITAQSSIRSSVVFAPHPDDETLGAGATIARKRAQDTDVTVVITADGRHSHKSRLLTEWELRDIRAEEGYAACAALGVDHTNVQQWGFEDTHVGEEFDALCERIEKVIDYTKPEEVLVICGRDWHIDHYSVNQAVRLVLREMKFGGEVLEFPVWFWKDGPWLERYNKSLLGKVAHILSDPIRATFTARPQLVSTAGFLSTKQRSWKAHVSQNTNLTGEPGWAIMDPSYVADFFGNYEVFFPVDVNAESSRGRHP